MEPPGATRRRQRDAPTVSSASSAERYASRVSNFGCGAGTLGRTRV